MAIAHNKKEIGILFNRSHSLLPTGVSQISNNQSAMAAQKNRGVLHHLRSSSGPLGPVHGAIARDLVFFEQLREGRLDGNDQQIDETINPQHHWLDHGLLRLLPPPAQHYFGDNPVRRQKFLHGLVELQKFGRILENLEPTCSFLLRQALLHPTAQEGLVKTQCQFPSFHSFGSSP